MTIIERSPNSKLKWWVTIKTIYGQPNGGWAVYTKDQAKRLLRMIKNIGLKATMSRMGGNRIQRWREKH